MSKSSCVDKPFQDDDHIYGDDWSSDDDDVYHGKWFFDHFLKLIIFQTLLLSFTLPKCFKIYIRCVDYD